MKKLLLLPLLFLASSCTTVRNSAGHTLLCTTADSQSLAFNYRNRGEQISLTVIGQNHSKMVGATFTGATKLSAAIGTAFVTKSIIP